MWKQCILCDIKQVEKITNICHLNKATQKELETMIYTYFKQADKTKTNPEIMADIWNIITKKIGNDDPYKGIKTAYNTKLITLYDELKSLIQSSNDSFVKALHIAITGNLIDFSANHTFDMQLLIDNIKRPLQSMAIDDSEQLRADLKKAKQLLFIGDNCGEIVLDKLFIQEIQAMNPTIHVYYGVRGQPIVNDITYSDTIDVHMEECATVISNGDNSLGTVLERTSSQFRKIYQESDVVICKGQGNYEGLLTSNKLCLYFLFMAKCAMIANPLHIDTLSIVCMKKANY